MEWWVILIACIGAASWIPHIIFFFYKLLSKPKLQFISDPIVEVGYSMFGPILNPSFAIATSRKDALLERIKIEVIHESGDKHEFIWKSLDEKGPEMISFIGEVISEMRKYQPAIALKIGMLGLVEKKILFRDISFQEKSKLLYSSLSEKMEFIDKTVPETYPESVFKTKEFLEFLDFIKKGFYWKEGKYEVNLYAYETSLKTPHIEYYNFDLTKANVDLLERNIVITQEFEKDTVLFKGGKIKKFPKRYWNWIYPSISKTKTKKD